MTRINDEVAVVWGRNPRLTIRLSRTVARRDFFVSLRPELVAALIRLIDTDGDAVRCRGRAVEFTRGEGLRVLLRVDYHEVWHHLRGADAAALRLALTALDEGAECIGRR